METDPTIRHANINELATLLEFEQGIVAAERHFNPTLKSGEIHFYDLAALVESPSAAVFVAEVDGKIVGSGYVLEKTAKDYVSFERYAYLGFMYVVPEHRGQGINQAIVDASMEWAKERGLTEFRLDVYNENLTAVKAYQKAGFKTFLLEMRFSLDEN